LDDGSGVSISHCWDDILESERPQTQGTNYPTQKPEALLERVINGSSNQGDLVADFFCGSGTHRGGRRKAGQKMDL